jgi:hypothetical protein
MVANMSQFDIEKFKFSREKAYYEMLRDFSET